MKNNTIYLFLIFTIINIPSKANSLEYNITSSKSDLNPLSINSKDGICSTYVPSLFNPILLVNFGTYIGPIDQHFYVVISNPIMKPSEYDIYNYNLMVSNISTFFGLKTDGDLPYCYFGLSSGLSEDINPKLENSTLEHLKITNQISEKKFSFEKWDLTSDPNNFKSTLYLGYNHKDFNSQNKKYIGTCQNIKEDKFWGCYFKEMTINNIKIPLNKSDEEDYKIYFSNEDYTITFPNEYLDIFEQFFNKSCTFAPQFSTTTCKDWFKEDLIIPLTLSNDNMDIILEIDSIARFNSLAERDSIKMAFKDIDCIIFPLIMFKNFHVQFDAEDNIIRFYSTDKKILHVKIKEPQQENNNSSSILTVFLMIIIILLLLGLSFVIYYFIKKRRNGNLKQINSFAKFEEEDEFKTMNEKKVF